MNVYVTAEEFVAIETYRAASYDLALVGMLRKLYNDKFHPEEVNDERT